MGKHVVFQSHAGSIEALEVVERLRSFGAVSIPRWFD